MIPPPIPAFLFTGTVQALASIYQRVSPTQIAKDAERRYHEGNELAQKFHNHLTKANLDEITDFAKRYSSSDSGIRSHLTCLKRRAHCQS